MRPFSGDQQLDCSQSAPSGWWLLPLGELIFTCLLKQTNKQTLSNPGI